MSVSELPTASAVAAVSTDDSETISTPVEEIDVPTYIAAAKHFDAADLFKIISALLKMAEKQSKGGKSTKRGATVKKAKDAPKGKTPRQLHKNNAWVAWTLEYARQNGWESFIVKAKSKDKETGEVTEEEIEMPASELHDGCYIYEGSVTESTPAGRQIIHKEAMSLSKHYWSAKNSTGTRSDLYEEFLKTYEEPAESETESVATKSTATSKVTVRKTAAEKAEEKAAKDKAAQEEKDRKAKEREAKKEETAARKQRERDAVEQRKADRAEAKKEKDRLAQEAKERKEAEKAGKVKKTAVKATPVKAAAVVKAAAKPVPAAAAPKPVAAPAPAPVPVKAAGGAGAKRPVEEWVAPAEGQVKSWSFKGKTYFRNSDNELWLKKADGQMGEWQGVYLPAEGTIDDSVPEPIFEEDEE